MPWRERLATELHLAIAGGWETFWAPRQALSRRNHPSRPLPVIFYGISRQILGASEIHSEVGCVSLVTGRKLSILCISLTVSLLDFMEEISSSMGKAANALQYKCQLYNVRMQQNNMHILHWSVQSTWYIISIILCKNPAKPSSITANKGRLRSSCLLKGTWKFMDAIRFQPGIPWLTALGHNTK